jgi:PAS domain S-box-containing protein
MQYAQSENKNIGESLDPSRVENEHFIAQVTNTIPDILYVYDFSDRRIIYINPRASIILGYGASEFKEMSHSFVERLVHPDDLAGYPAWFSRVNRLELGEIFEHEFRVRHKDGRLLWLRSRETVFKHSSSGEIVQILAIATDVTDRKMIEEALIESDTRNASILKAVPDLMFLQHEDGTYLDYYARDKSELLVPPEDFLGRNMRDILPAKILNVVVDTFEKTKASDLPQRAEYSLSANGDARHFEFRSVRSGKDKILSIVRDVTDQKRTEQALKQSVEFNNSIIQSSDDCIKILDLEGTLEYINSRGHELLEMGDESFIGRQLPDLWPEEDRNKLKVEFEKAISGGVGRHTGQCSTVRGTNKWWDVLISPITDADGRVDRLLVVSRDITKQKLADEKLLQKEKFFRSLIENASDLVTVLRPDGGIIYESPACERMFGYRPDERLGCNCLDYIHPDDLARVTETFQQAQSNGAEPEYIEYRYRHKDGSYVSLEVIGHSSFDEDGQPIIIVNKRDITERKVMEEKLRTSEELYRNVVETQTELICRFLPDSTLTFVNEAYCRYFDKTREELIGKKYLELIPEDSRPIAAGVVRSLIESRVTQTVEHEVIRADGNIGWHQWIDYVICDENGELVELQGIGRDITDRKRFEKALSASEEKYRQIVDTMMEGIWVVDTEIRIMLVNNQLAEMLNYPVEEMVGKYAYDFILEKTDADLKEIKERRRSGVSEQYDAKLRRKDGSYVWVLISATPIHDENGTYSGSLAMIADITERKHNEEQLKELASRLLNLQDEERRRLARELHDETAQNLAALNVGLSRIKPILTPDQTDAISLISESESLCQKSLKEVRTISYLLHPPLLDERGLGRALSWFVNGFSERSGIIVDYFHSPEIERLPYEIESALFRVVQEALTNIHRHSGSNVAHISLTREQDQIILVVRDEGRGMSEDPHISDGIGVARLGVGIPGMRERLRLVGGQLKISSTPNGTTLKGVVPLSAA